MSYRELASEQRKASFCILGQDAAPDVRAPWHEGLANLPELEYEQTGRDQLHREPASDRPTPGIRESNLPPHPAALFVPWQPRSTRQDQHPDGLQSQPLRAVHRFKQVGKNDSLAV